MAPSRSDSYSHGHAPASAATPLPETVVAVAVATVVVVVVLALLLLLLLLVLLLLLLLLLLVVVVACPHSPPLPSPSQHTTRLRPPLALQEIEPETLVVAAVRCTLHQGHLILYRFPGRCPTMRIMTRISILKIADKEPNREKHLAG